MDSGKRLPRGCPTESVATRMEKHARVLGAWGHTRATALGYPEGRDVICQGSLDKCLGTRTADSLVGWKRNSRNILGRLLGGVLGENCQCAWRSLAKSWGMLARFLMQYARCLGKFLARCLVMVEKCLGSRANFWGHSRATARGVLRNVLQSDRLFFANPVRNLGRGLWRISVSSLGN